MKRRPLAEEPGECEMGLETVSTENCLSRDSRPSVGTGTSKQSGWTDGRKSVFRRVQFLSQRGSTGEREISGSWDEGSIPHPTSSKTPEQTASETAPFLTRHPPQPAPHSGVQKFLRPAPLCSEVVRFPPGKWSLEEREREKKHF